MSVIRFLLLLFAFFGVLVSCAAAVLMVVVMLRFTPLLIAVALACWVFVVVLRKIGIRITGAK